MALGIFRRLTGRPPTKTPASRARLVDGVEPLSYEWGADRGTPLCRYYLDQFLQEFAADVQGHCLEFEGDDYTRGYGHDLTRADILHVDASNPKATLVADLTQPNDIPSDRFACVICTHVLHIIFEMERFVAELHRILKPGGVLLIAVPHVSMADPQWHELWRFTQEGLQRLLAKVFGADRVTTRAYGNSLTAAGQIRGLATEEFTPEELNHHDPRFAVEICGRAVK
jgi:SAM-dependent methyltransferase